MGKQNKMGKGRMHQTRKLIIKLDILIQVYYCTLTILLYMFYFSKKQQFGQA